MAVGGANGDGVRAVSRAANCVVGHLVNGGAICVVAGDDIGAAEIAGTANHHDSRPDCYFNRLAEGVRMKGFANRHAQAQVGNANVIAFTILNHPVDGGKDVAGAADTVLIKHANVNQVGARSNAGVVCCITAGGCATPCRYAGYAGSVAISIAAAFAAAEID